jgi:transcriptional regulator of acetoin/glycerol metabolism
MDGGGTGCGGDWRMRELVREAMTRPDGHVRTLDEIETEAIRLALELYRGNLSEAARRLGIGRSTLYRKLPRARKG